MEFVSTRDGRYAVRGHEREILAELGITLPLRRNVHQHCPYPDHVDRHPSWRWDDARAVAFCTCSTGDIFHVTMKMRGGDFGDAKVFAGEAINRHDLIRGRDDGRYYRPEPPPRPAPTPPTPAFDPVEEDERQERSRQRALQLWGEAIPIHGTLAEAYLSRRGIDFSQLPLEIDGALRFHPDCPFGSEKRPCLLALFTDAVTCEPRAIHRLAPRPAPDDDTADKKMLGPTKGCVVRLWPDDAVEQGLVFGEGIETTLAAATRIDRKDGTLLRPAWAAGSSSNMAGFPTLAGIEAITILVDHDPAGKQAALECAKRWKVAECYVIRLMPGNEGDDFNDLTKQKASA